MKKIFYGIGQGVMRDFRDRKKIITLCDMQDLTIESTSSQESVTGGNKMTSIADFDKEKEIKISATNATFEDNIMPYLDGFEEKTGVAVFPAVMELTIDSSMAIVLDDSPIEGSVIVNGFKAVQGDAELAKGEYKVSTAEKKITFSSEDVGSDVVVFYEYNSSANTVNYGAKQGSMKKPFEFVYKQPLYDEDSQVAGTMVIVIYKARTTSGFSIEPKHLTPYAPKFEAKALDPKRSDKKVWDCFIDLKSNKSAA